MTGKLLSVDKGKTNLIYEIRKYHDKLINFILRYFGEKNIN